MVSATFDIGIEVMALFQELANNQSKSKKAAG
jgi:hypothetical protein